MPSPKQAHGARQNGRGHAVSSESDWRNSRSGCVCLHACFYPLLAFTASRNEIDAHHLFTENGNLLTLSFSIQRKREWMTSLWSIQGKREWMTSSWSIRGKRAWMTSSRSIQGKRDWMMSSFSIHRKRDLLSHSRPFRINEIN